MKRNGAKKWPFGFGALYVFSNMPLIIFTKIGITGVSASKRAKEVDKAAPGVPFPIMVVFIPFAYQVEQLIHRILAGFNFVFYKGDGHTEWFVLVGYVLAWLMVKYYWLPIDTFIAGYTGLEILNPIYNFIVGLL